MYKYTSFQVNNRNGYNAYSAFSKAFNSINKKHTTNINTSTNSNVNLSTRKKYISSNLEELKFNNNVLNLRNGKNYRVKTLTNGFTDIAVKGSFNANLVFYDLHPTEDIANFFSEPQFNDMNQMVTLIKCISGNKPVEKKVDLIRIFMPNSLEVKARLESLGAEAGKMIKLSENSEEVFFDTNGWLYTKKELDLLYDSYKQTNYFEFGFTKDSKLVYCDGREFKINNKGTFDLPDDVICTPSRIKAVK
ncbi:hypothetical protein J2Z44_004307 [Clostridium punense]|uniref:Uncharacterized protein n=1 Tax=Clostridium punense TaxID=1054297 RepID=A0ABS4K9H7_9CLOT|nr:MULTISPECIES: hypothetical protein [Clostridium]EQB88988.1 hypothetical protein M918_22405 [Clostridium sp. BL8]MBP2024438.1 hypothetical protein [Clostridium punense]